ncbi:MULTISPECIES: hypothetical protein [Streptomycetaceae]|uniref:Uncharacterized protein n=1 Tax=Streptantibioticus cattleyicolor (strain ATCC 35852 / DSM 46488 / JCM 4925 / NBRC 14057 / NRRL 8057) TaxID=1003195 RepID=F8JY39_STREN|nr:MULTISPECIES: hypothetical protein [Streptomycetaceae]AEW94615.1 hypothetical protein SCATT_22440 [Streptantibioticus cattleyicolor NRRL 8057 = DSM 46488]MYS59253.1 hypothetical protein [Streptomyces sp. SID5468]CCB74972.1 protein of unknown function [Streptantibioticus cattleyicolor NRRL 8057 = DSM 46488]
MADENNDEHETMGSQIALLYIVIVLACRILPIPVELPRETSAGEAAIRRLLDILDEQPMPDEQKAHLSMACAFWLSAQDLHQLNAANWQGTRQYQIAANLMAGEGAITEFSEWAMGNRSNE